MKRHTCDLRRDGLLALAVERLERLPWARPALPPARRAAEAAKCNRFGPANEAVRGAVLAAIDQLDWAKLGSGGWSESYHRVITLLDLAVDAYLEPEPVQRALERAGLAHPDTDGGPSC